MWLKSPTDIENIITSGRCMGEILAKAAAACAPGRSVWEIDRLAEQLIRAAGGRPAFKGYKTHAADRPFPATICASLNEELVHGIPRKNVVLKEGDIFSIDIGMEWPAKNLKLKNKNSKSSGVFTDTAITVAIGEIPLATKKLLQVTQESLEEGIKAALPGNTIADIGRAVEQYVKSQGNYGIVRDLVGHGVGHAVHEDPFIPNYYDKKLESIKLEPGMVIAIEPMIAMGDWHVETMDDGWTIRMKDRSLCAHFEHTIIITETGNVTATRRPNEISNY